MNSHTVSSSSVIVLSQTPSPKNNMENGNALSNKFLCHLFCMVDIERFSDRYREKKTDEGLEWQPGNINNKLKIFQ